MFQTAIEELSYLRLWTIKHFLICHRGYEAKMVTFGRLDVHDVWSREPKPLPLDAWSYAAMGQWNPSQRRWRCWWQWWWWRGRGKTGGAGERCFPQGDTQKEVMEAPQQEIGQYSQDVWVFFCLHPNRVQCCSIPIQLKASYPSFQGYLVWISGSLLFQHSSSFAVQPCRSTETKGIFQRFGCGELRMSFSLF